MKLLRCNKSTASVPGSRLPMAIAVDDLDNLDQLTPAADPLAALRAMPVSPARGWAVRGGGRDHHVGQSSVWQGTSTQLAGLYPFLSGSGAQVRGIPIGRDLTTHEPIGLDPGAWLADGLVTNTGLWIQAQPGVGKSSFAKRLGVGLCAFGWIFFIPADIKGEYTQLVRRLGGTVIVVGRGAEAVNPLDPGPLAALLAVTPAGRERDAVREIIRARQAALLEGLLLLEIGRPPNTTERAILSRALDLATDAARSTEPTIPEVRECLDEAPDQLLQMARTDDDLTRYLDLVRPMLSALDLLCDGPLRGLFDRRSTARPTADAPAISLDISALDEETDETVAAAMLCSWAWGSALVEARQLGAARKNIFWVQDEMWRALRAGPRLVELSDRMTRFNRHKGVASAYLTHSRDDLEALPSEQDRAKARGIAARCAIHVYGGLPTRELASLPVADREAEMLASWQSAGTWVRGYRHPGRGLYLLKAGERLGLPVRMELTEVERELYNTDTAFVKTVSP
ncbi:hypothetical protein [Solihabitans fulvus]|uniref:hypothetical protein n=1 Tax=Solihabitans fulvus TaxID=1892852 RepID=UPI001CB75D8A|nr:hypothetical protein [Solihabitans fulvus]